MAATSDQFARLAPISCGSSVTCNYPGADYQKVWGVLPAFAGNAPQGTITLEVSGSITCQDLQRGVVTACRPTSVQVTDGIVYLVLV